MLEATRARVQQYHTDEKKKAATKKKRQERLQFTGATALFVTVCACIILMLTQLVFPYFDYKTAQKELSAGNMEVAVSMFRELDGFMDSEEQCSLLREAMDTDVPTDPFVIARMR